MGWCIKHVYDKDILESDVQTIVNNLSPGLCSPMGNSKQSWGWTTGVDIKNPEKNKIRISGSYGLSGHIAEEFSDVLKEGLGLFGYKCLDVEFDW
jgi:hypothetical protein